MIVDVLTRLLFAFGVLSEIAALYKITILAAVAIALNKLSVTPEEAISAPRAVCGYLKLTQWL